MNKRTPPPHVAMIVTLCMAFTVIASFGAFALIAFYLASGGW